MIVASLLKYVSSDWIAIEAAVVLPKCTCGRGIAAYDRTAVSSFGEHGYVAWTCYADDGGRGDHRAVARVEAGAIMAMATRVPFATRAPYWAGARGLQAAGAWLGSHSCAVIERTASGSSCVAPWPAAAEALLSS